MIALVLGSAQCVHEDMQKAQAAILAIPPRDYVVIAVNYTALHYHDMISALATMHAEKAKAFLDERTKIQARMIGGCYPDYRTFCINDAADVRNFTKLPTRWGHVSSGIYGAQVAIDAYDCDVILCGCPLDGEEGHIHHTERHSYDPYLRRLGQIPVADKSRIRSMSGYTKDFFGAPDRAFVEASYA